MVGAGTAAASYKGQQDAAKTTASYQKSAALEGQALARQSWELQNQQESERQKEESQASSQQISSVNREASKARASARVAAGEAGVSGLSVDALLADFDRQEASSVNAINYNREMNARQSSMNLRGIRANAMNQLSSTRFKPVARPSALNSGLEIAGMGLDAYTKYKP